MDAIEFELSTSCPSVLTAEALSHFWVKPLTDLREAYGQKFYNLILLCNTAENPGSRN